MFTRFLTVEIALQASPQRWQEAIATELQKWGEPLRWAIVALDEERQVATLEAVVTPPTEFLIPATAVTTL
jgi:hypothetical protein